MAEQKVDIKISASGGALTAEEFRRVGAAANAELAKIRAAGDPASAALRGVRGAAAEAGAAVQGLAAGAGPAGAALGALGPVGVAFAASIGLGVTALKAMYAAAEEAEKVSLRLDAVLKATGGTAGLTRKEIDALAETIEGSSLFDDTQVHEAAAALATFKTIAGGAFSETITLAADLAAVFGGDLKSNTVLLAKALEDPADGLTRLRRMGISFTEAQKDVITSLVETGRAAEAQGVILDVVRGKVGGSAAAENSGLAGAATGLGKAWDDLLKEWGRTPEIGGRVADVLRSISSGIDALRQKTAGDTAGGVAAASRSELEGLNADIDRIRRTRGGNDPQLPGLIKLRDIERQRAEDLAGFAREQARLDTGDKVRVQDRAALAAKEAEAERLLAAEKALAAEAEKERPAMLEKIEKALDNVRKAEIKAATEALDFHLSSLDEQAAREKLRTEEDRAEIKKREEAEKKSLEDLAKAQEKYRETIAASIQHTTDRIVDFGADAFATIFEGGESTFKKLGASILQIMKRTFAQVASEALLRPIITPIVGNIVGAVMGGGFPGGGVGSSAVGGGIAGGAAGSSFSLGNLGSVFSLGNSLFGGPSISGAFGSAIDGFGASLLPSVFGTAAGAGGLVSAAGAALPASEIFAGLPGVATGVGGASASLSSLLGGAGAGFAAGTLLNSLLGGNQVGGMVGSGLGAGAGALAGTFLFPGVGTLLGGLIGGAGGGVLGGMFGPGKSVGPNAGGTIAYNSDGTFSAGYANADNGGSTAPILAALNETADALNSLISAYDLDVDGAGFGRGGPRAAGIDSGIGPYAKSSEELFINMIRAGVLTGEGSIGLALKNTKATTAQGVEADIQFAQMIDGLTAANENADILSTALEAVAKKFDEMTERATELGLSLDDVAKARERELQATREQVSAQQTAGIRSLVQSLTFGTSSARSPAAQLASINAEYDQTVAAAQGGDAGAIQNFAAIARTKIDAAQRFYGVSSKLSDEIAGVLTTARGLVDQSLGGADVVQAIMLDGRNRDSLVKTLIERMETLINETRAGRLAGVERRELAA